jgi:hypothetical protein
MGVMQHLPLLPYLMPLLFVLVAGYRYLGGSSSADVDNAAVWAVRKGFLPADAPPPASTPTLELPDGQASDCWEVPVGDGTGTLYEWTWVIADNRSLTERELGVQAGMQMGRTTVIQALLAAGFPHFRVVPRHGFVAPAAGWDEERVELESVEFGQRFRLLAGRDGDREALLRLFSPETIVWFLQLGDAAPVVEYGMGSLVVSSRYACTTDLEYESLLESAQHLATAVLAEGLLHRPDPV